MIAAASVSATITCSDIMGTECVEITSVTATTDFTGTITWSAIGLPSGVIINSNSGIIGGTPDASSAGSFIVPITASNGTDTATKEIAVNIAEAAPPKSKIVTLASVSVFNVAAIPSDDGDYTADLGGVDLESKGVRDVNADGYVAKDDITESNVEVVKGDAGETYEVVSNGDGSFTINVTAENGTTQRDYT